LLDFPSPEHSPMAATTTVRNRLVKPLCFLRLQARFVSI